MQDLDIGIAEFGEPLARQFDQLRILLDGENLRNYLREDRCAIAGAGSNFERAIARTRRDCLDHQGNDVRLGDSLAALDWQRRIEVRELRQMRGDEELPRNLAHGVEQSGIANSARRNLIANHLQSRFI